MLPRVLSLIPSGTEIVSALGLGRTLVGRSHCCDHPPGVVELPALTRPRVDPELSGGEIDEALRRLLSAGEGVYDVDLELLARLEPDVILTQDGCDVCAVPVRQVERAVQEVATLAGARVCALHAHDLDGLRADFLAVGDALGSSAAGRRLRDRFDTRLAHVRERVAGAVPKRVALVEWLEPPMVAGGWMPELARIAGGVPVIVDEPRRFETVAWDDVRAAGADVVVLLPCGWGVQRTRRELARSEIADAVAEAAAAATHGVWIVDGDAYFNRPGPRLADSAEILARVLHPERFPPDGPAERSAVAGLAWLAGGPDLQRTISAPSSIE